jgi:hypothetical protein
LSSDISSSVVTDYPFDFRREQSQLDKAVRMVDLIE